MIDLNEILDIARTEPDSEGVVHVVVAVDSELTIDFAIHADGADVARALSMELLGAAENRKPTGLEVIRKDLLESPVPDVAARTAGPLLVSGPELLEDEIEEARNRANVRDRHVFAAGRLDPKRSGGPR